MTLYEYMKIEQNSMDTSDDVFDAVVTIEPIEDNDYKNYPDDENYYLFYLEIMKKAEVFEKSGDTLIVKWSDLITRNMEKFKAYTKENWYADCQYEDDEDEFIYQWINEIHLYLAGYVDEDEYKKLYNFAKSLN